MIIDLAIISVFISLILICLFTNRINFTQVSISFCYYCSTVLYASVLLGAASPWVDHLIYAALAIPFIFISSLPAALGLALYSLFNLAVSADYLFYPEIDTIVSNSFASIQMLLAILIIITSTLNGKIRDNRVANNIMGWLFSHNDSHSRLQKMEKK